jgi:membrane fusion protein (multidrug efflux system)
MTLSSKKLRIAAVLLVLILAFGVYWVLHRGQETTDDAQIDATIVTISPKVSGYIKTLHVDDNTLVKAGAVIAEIDPIDYQLKHDRTVAAGQSAHAMLTVAEVNYEKAQKDLARLQELGKLASSRQQLDDAMTAIKTTEASVSDAKGKIELAKAEFAQTEKDLNDTKLVAPMAGRVTRKGVEQGDYVVPGEQLMSIVSSDIWITANFKETQLTHMKVGQPVDIEVDAFPDETWHGTIDSFQSGTGARFSAFPAENATGNFVKIVQRVPVKIKLDKQPDANRPLGPGMSVIATVHTDR